MDKEMESLLRRLGAATTVEQDFEKLKLKVIVGLMASIDDLSNSIGALVNNIEDCRTCNNKGSKSQNAS